MNKEDIIRMAREAGFESHDISLNFPKELERFAALVASAEREACALRAEEFLTEPEPDWDGDFWNQAIERVALTIRARGDKHD